MSIIKVNQAGTITVVASPGSTTVSGESQFTSDQVTALSQLAAQSEKLLQLATAYTTTTE